MSAGTLTLTNNSAAVSGSGTSFTTELAAADFIVVTVGGIPYTLPVKTVDSTTALTLVSNYTGPTQAGAAWYAVPRVAMNLVTAALVAQSAEALRGLNYDKQNWQQIFAGSGTATIKIPDGTSFTGPTWNSLATSLASKADKTALDGKADKSSLGNAAALNVGTTANTVAAGDDSRLGTVNGKSGGTISGTVTINGSLASSAGVIGSYLVALNGAGYKQPLIIDSSGSSAIFSSSYKYNNGSGYELNTGFGAVGTGNSSWPASILMQTANDSAFGARIWIFSMSSGDLICNGSGSQPGSYTFTKAATSDRTLKHDITYNDGLQSYENVKKIKPCSFVYNNDKEERARRGVIAQDVREIDEEYVKEVRNYFDNTSTLALDTNVLLLDALLALKVAILKIEELEGVVKQLPSGS
ncbi:tail fiber domain-containing protein [Kosakonia sp. R1.Fl]|uniref:tail fiber domain-containing protein n=1 Tax=Kosakonia sp. R1.Fl TaxID=2928706 RepID=UPI00201DE276|nr:tail fiber domain-containing protein [Kosakonia sp. R1.Fl]MCL6744446.1 tail fiber domain-containing protein [Kosakonia sp. R1.Fl]